MSNEVSLDVLRELQVIRMLLTASAVDGLHRTDGYELLSKVGLAHGEIAQFYGTTAHAVGVSLANRRRRSKSSAPAANEGDDNA